MRCLLSSFLLYEKINEEHLPFLTARFPLFEFFLSFFLLYSIYFMY